MPKPRPLPLLSSHHASLAETVRVLQERRRLLKWLGAAAPSPCCRRRRWPAR